MRLDSLGYRLVWNLKRIFRVKNAGPRPIIWGQPKTYEVSSAWRKTLNVEQKRKLESLMEELRLITRIYTYTPSRITDAQFAQFLELPTRRARFDYLHFLRQKEYRREADKRRGPSIDSPVTNVEKEGAGRMSVDPTGQPLKLVAASPNYMDRCERQAERMRFINSVRLAETPRIIVDCRFLQDHSLRGMNLTLMQLAQLVSFNRQRVCPWPLYFANFDLTKLRLRKHNSNLSVFDEANELCVEISAKSYLEMFPEAAASRKIVYLSPHADESLERVDVDTYYVIGGIVDRVAEPLIDKHASRVTAEAENLPCYRLPLDEHLEWKSGNRLLTITGVVSILQNVYDAGGADWKPVLEKLIPVRKLRNKKEKNPFVRTKYENMHLHKRAVMQILNDNLPEEVEEEDREPDDDQPLSAQRG